jgi:YD repeat-containing protein
MQCLPLIGNCFLARRRFIVAARVNDAAGQLLTENGPFASDTVTNTYSNRRRIALSLQQPSGTWTNGFGWAGARRLTNVTSAAGAFSYQYISGAQGLVSRIGLPNTAYITNTYDSVARLTATLLNNSGNTTLDSASYGYNVGNQRTASTNAAGAHVSYTYDKIGQLTIADSSTNSEDRGYAYAAAWNLHYLTNNGTPSTFSVDGKNELTNAPGGTLTFDSNGNALSRNGSHDVMVYDDENRLVQWYHYQTGVSSPTDGDLGTDFVYDGLGRLRERLENCFWARRRFIVAARVRDNWFSLVLILAPCCQTGSRVSSGKFCRFWRFF